MPEYTGQSLAWLNGYMKDKQTDEICETLKTNVSLLKALQGCINKEDFYGEYSDIVMELGQPRTGKAHYSNGDIPAAQHATYKTMRIPTKEMIATAGITMQAMNRAKGGLTAWGNATERSLKLLLRDMDLTANLAAIGDGTGKLARVASISGTNTAGVRTLVLTCDNTYADFGWENVDLIAVGMHVDVYAADGTTVKMLDAVVTVTPTVGRRTQAGSWAATTGTVTLEGTVTASLADNDVIYVADTKPSLCTTGNTGYWSSGDKGLPMGLAGLFNDGVIYGDTNMDATAATFQGLTRATYSTLRARIYAAASSGSGAQANVNPFGLLTESPAFGTPTYWGISDINNILIDIGNGDGAGTVTDMFCSLELAGALARKSAELNQIQVVVSDVGKEFKVNGGRIASKFIGPNGEEITINVSKTMPKHCLYMCDTNDMELLEDEPFGYLKRSGDIWEPQPGSRKTNFEAPYYGSYQIGASRCDNMAVMMDMRYDI